VTANAGWRAILTEEKVRMVLHDFGVTEKEAEIYIFLAKHGSMKGGEISKRAKTHKALVYRILGSLQKKGFVESTLEVPARFTAVNFETVIDLNIRAKQEEARKLESTKKELLSYWRNVRQATAEPTPEKFTVIEGSHKIYPKISQMIRETKNQLSAVSTVPGLLRAESLGLFEDMLSHPLRKEIQFRFLTDLSVQNLEAVKNLLKKITKTKFNLKGRNPQLGLQLAPRMVIRDHEEILFFITPMEDASATGRDEACLWTDSKELVRAFAAVFDDLWRNSTDIKKNILELETGKPAPKTCVINDATTARKVYEETVGSAKAEILMLTSARGLIEHFRNIALVKEWAEKGVSVKIMAPITSENLNAALTLSKYCAVRHASASHLGTTIVDGQHLFQFKTSLANRGSLEDVPHFEDTVYTSDREYCEKTKIMLNNIWMNAPVPSKVTLEVVLGSKPLVPRGTPTDAGIKIIKKAQWYGAVDVAVDKKPLGTEKELLKKVLKYEKDPARTVAYGSTGQVIVHPPANLGLPCMMIDCWHVRRGTFGEGNTLVISLWLNTPNGYTFVPVAVVETSTDLRILDFYRTLFGGTPAEKNVVRVTDKELQVWKQGGSLFAGWTMQIPLQALPCYLPPSCLLFERIGEARTQKYTILFPSGYKGTVEYTGFDAFVTFMNPTWKYAAPATEAVFGMNVIMTSIAP
jgi:sugar-specific transcriptional regulator TrmB